MHGSDWRKFLQEFDREFVLVSVFIWLHVVGGIGVFNSGLENAGACDCWPVDGAGLDDLVWVTNGSPETHYSLPAFTRNPRVGWPVAAGTKKPNQ